MKEIKNNLKNECEHSIVVRMHDSMITGISREYLPNPNHVGYYCVYCGKRMTKEEVLPWDHVIDLFGHEDALEVGYNNFKAIIDYLQHMIEEQYKKDPFYADEHVKDYMKEERIAQYLKTNFKRVPKEYIRTE